MNRASRLRAGDDDGIALITVMGAVTVIGALIMLALAQADTALRSSRQHSNFEGALTSAEAGIDANLARISAAYNSSPSTNYVTPSPCSVPQPSAADLSSDASERTWARTQLESLPQNPCMVRTPQGDYVAVRPQGRQAVYSLSWWPRRSDPNAKKRLLKAEYLFAPYKPGNAILAQGNIDLAGSVTVNAVNPALPANVHTNGNVVGPWASSISIAGAVSSSGTSPSGCPAGITGGCTSAEPTQDVPVLDPRAVYNQHALLTPEWRDFCTSPGGVGEVRRPASTGPCTGTLVGRIGFDFIEYNGWSYGVVSGIPRWTLASGSSSYPGAYYVYGADAQVGSTGTSSADRYVTVMAEALPTGGPAARCGKFGGEVEWKLFSLRPYLSGLLLHAHGNIIGGANADAGPGLFVAGDKIDISTSSSNIQGAMIAGNRCTAAGVNRVQGVTLKYDETVESPVNDVIRTSLWLEYQSG